MRVKTCTRCGETKPLDQFPPRRRGEPRLQSWCRSCFAANNARYYLEHRDAQRARLYANSQRRRNENRRRAAEYLATHPCVDCGESDILVLDFDHVGGKTSAISAMIARGASWQQIEAEIAKCEIRCANCHRIRTAATWNTIADTPPLQESAIRAMPLQLELVSAREPRVCRVCGQLKAAAEFPFRSLKRQTRQWICLQCQREYTREWYQRNRDRQIAATRRNNVRRKRRAASGVRAVRQQLACVGCGESNPLVLDFDHLRDKTADVSTMVRLGLPWVRIEDEIAKCQPLCANCHRRKTARDQNWWKGLAS